jgi:hypothetical protein
VSSLVIVPVAALGEPTPYPLPEATVRITVSSGSTVASTVGSIVTVAVEFPAAKVTLPFVPVNVAAPL